MRIYKGLVIAALIAAPALAFDKGDAVKKLRQSDATIKAIMESPDNGIPEDLLSRAECVGVFPDLKKAAFVIGGTFGRGVFTCRRPDGAMGAPAFFTLGGGSFGWQFGGQEADLVLLIMNKQGMDHLLSDRFTIGGEASATAGPVGRTAKAATDAQLNAQMLSWSRSQGAFLGASIDGTVIKPHIDANEMFYGKPVSARDILLEGKVSTPDQAKPFVATVSRNAMRSEVE